MSTSRSQAWTRVQPLLLIGAGGFAGAVLRYGLSVGLPSGLPWGTLAANVGGAFLLGALLSDSRLTNALGVQTRLAIGTGFCSSLSTYSTFAVETAQLSAGLATANVIANYALGFGAILLGQVVARWLS